MTGRGGRWMAMRSTTTRRPRVWSIRPTLRAELTTRLPVVFGTVSEHGHAEIAGVPEAALGRPVSAGERARQPTGVDAGEPLLTTTATTVAPVILKRLSPARSSRPWAPRLNRVSPQVTRQRPGPRTGPLHTYAA